MGTQTTISPVDGRVWAERPLAEGAEIEAALQAAAAAAKGWAAVPLADRVAAVGALTDALVARKDALAEEITWQMGRPIRHSPGEIDGFAERARALLEMAPGALADLALPEKAGFTRKVRREPLGVVLVLAPWNYPYLTAVNAIAPALLAGNVVVLKPSDQTPVCAERIVEAAADAGLPRGVVSCLHASHEATARMVADPRVAYVAFTGSVAGGRAVHAAAGGHLKAVGLELGGKDAAYVRPDAEIEATAAGLVDGAFFNAGQSCCGIERIYVHRDRYDAIVEAIVAETKALSLGDPTDPQTTLGPVVRSRNAEAIRAVTQEAIAAGADPADRRRALRGGRTRRPVPRTAGPRGRRSPDAGDAGGDLRARGRDRTRRRRRPRRRDGERQRVRAHRQRLDGRSGRRFRPPRSESARELRE